METIASRYTTPDPAAALAEVGLNAQEQSDFVIVGRTPAQIANHDTELNILCYAKSVSGGTVGRVSLPEASAVASKDLQYDNSHECRYRNDVATSKTTDLFGETQFNFDALELEFTKVCPDYVNNPDWETGSLARYFCCEMLFKVSPCARHVKKGDRDKCWKFRFLVPGNDQQRPTYGVVFVATFKSTPAPQKPPKFTGNQMILTIEQACLLATYTLSKMVMVALQHDVILLTPLAGAVFCKQDIDRILVDLGKDVNDLTAKAELIRSIIESCQNGGQHLPNSRAYIAACALDVSTRNLKNVNVRERIINNTMKQYLAKGKAQDHKLYMIFRKYATGGVPAEFSPENLIKIMDEVQKLSLEEFKRTSVVITQSAAGVRDGEQASGAINKQK